ncbi:MAG: Neopullulanase 2, partial [Planctomycetota bacterium]
MRRFAVLSLCAAALLGWPLAARAAAVPPSVEVAEIAGGRMRVTFAFRADRAESEVFLAGDFNGWSPTKTRMERMGDGVCRATVEMDEGRRLYKFVVDGRWMADPRNPEREPDGHDGFNSVLVVGGDAAFDAKSARKGDGKIETAACRHEPARQMWMQQAADGAALVRYRALAGDVESVELVLEGLEPQPMGSVVRVGSFDWWQIRIPSGNAEKRYAFVVKDGATQWTDPAEFRVPVFAVAVPFKTPDWAKGAVWYQIMVDRFRNGDRANDPEPVRPWTSDWEKPSDFEGKDGQTMWRWFAYNRFYGGDLAGIREKIPYLRSLGVTAVYLNPVFEAPSPHKYDARSFVHIDDNFGTKGDYAAASAAEDLAKPGTWTFTASDRAFIELVAELHKAGIKVVLDGVFNHVGDQHEAFADVRANGAKSRFSDWFAIKSFEPFSYEGWAGFGQLPAFAKSEKGFASDAVRRHIFAVTRRWMDPNMDGDPSDGIDGWRLDVPNEVPMPFWREWRAHVKAINPDAYISGEIWSRADDWLGVRGFDAVMNYPFASAAVQWVGGGARKITASELDSRLAELRLAYPDESTHALMNLVDSHDTDRVASMMRNP